MTRLLAILLCLCAVTGQAQIKRISQEPTTNVVADFDDFIINKHTSGTNYTTRRINATNLVAPTGTIGRAISNAAKSRVVVLGVTGKTTVSVTTTNGTNFYTVDATQAAQLWTNAAGILKPTPTGLVPVQIRQGLIIGSDPDPGFLSVATNGVVVYYKTADGGPQEVENVSAIIGPGSFTLAYENTSINTNRVLNWIENENDDLGHGFTLTREVNTTNVYIQGRSWFQNVNYWRLSPALLDEPYFFRTTARGAGELFHVANAGTNSFTVTYSGNTTNLGQTDSTLGFASYATNATITVISTGITNNTGRNYRLFGLTGTSILQTNLTRGVGFSRGTITTPTDVVLQPNEFVTGTSIAVQGSQAF